jgi:electron transfer flavoprotein beta subunit
VSPTSVYSSLTERAFKYNEGVRFAPLPAIMAAKRKPLEVKPLAQLVPDAARSVSYHRFELPPARKAGQRVADVRELVQKLTQEAKVL